MEIEKYLEEWKNIGRQKWTRYNQYFDKFLEVRKLMNEIPSPDKFASDILEMVKGQNKNSVVGKDTIIEIFSRKSPSSWVKIGGEERLSRGKDDYLGFLENELGGLDPNVKSEISKYLDQLNENLKDLIDQPFASHATPWNTFNIINGNKYTRILSLIQFIRDDDRKELVKYRWASVKQDPTEDEYREKHRFMTLGTIIFELYGIANLMRDKVYIYNSRIRLSEFGYETESPEDFSGLFDFMNKYDLFAHDKYKDYFLDKDEKFKQKVKDFLTPEEIENLLRHIEIDQFFSTYDENEGNEGEISEAGSEQTRNTPDNTASPDASESQPSDQEIPINIILHGPVGTGKTLIANIIASRLLGNGGPQFETINDLLTMDLSNFDFSSLKPPKFQMVTFHQSYGYEEFIQGLTAEIKSGTNELRYVVKPGKFVVFCREAKSHPDEKYVFIIDEINRGDISRIFGELITLVEEDKRCNIRKPEQGLSVSLPRKDESREDSFCVPDNVYIIGTMNDSDRSIALLDVALRRRFTFYEVRPNEKLLSGWLSNNANITHNSENENLIAEALKGLNRRIAAEKSKDYEIGHAFFTRLKDCKDDPIRNIQLIFRHHVIPLLEEFFYGEEKVLHKEILKGEFYKEESPGYYTLDEGLFTEEGKGEFLNALVKLKEENP